MDNNSFKELQTSAPPPELDELDRILGGVEDKSVVVLSTVTPADIVEELQRLEDVDKLLPIISRLMQAEAESKGKRMYPKRLLRNQHIIAYLLLNPFATTMEVCKFFGVSPSVLYTLSKSDTFKALASQYAVKIDNNPDIQQQLKDTMAAAIEVTQQALTNNPDPDYALAVLDKTANRLGMGAKQGTNVNIQNNILTPEMIAVARQQKQRRLSAPDA